MRHQHIILLSVHGDSQHFEDAKNGEKFNSGIHFYNVAGIWRHVTQAVTSDQNRYGTSQRQNRWRRRGPPCHENLFTGKRIHSHLKTSPFPSPLFRKWQPASRMKFGQATFNHLQDDFKKNLICCQCCTSNGAFFPDTHGSMSMKSRWLKSIVYSTWIINAVKYSFLYCAWSANEPDEEFRESFALQVGNPSCSPLDGPFHPFHICPACTLV